MWFLLQVFCQAESAPISHGKIINNINFNYLIIFLQENQHPGHAGPFYVVEDVDSVQDIILEDGVEISVGVDGVNIMEGVAIG